MKFGLHIPNFGPFGSARVAADLAARAEAAGWDGIFVWDHVVRHEGDFDLAEPWIALAAMAMTTSRVTIGPLVTPLPRRRPANVAKSAVTLDHLSDGRLVLGVGIGSSRGPEFAAFGEEVDPRRRGDLLDEGLAVVRDAWSGQPVHHAGTGYRIDGIRFLPRPLQAGGIPLWGAAESVRGRALRRAATLDGIFPIGIEPDDLPALLRSLGDAGRAVPAGAAAGRTDERPFDIVVAGGGGPARWEGSGVTWWLAALPWREPLDASLRIVDRGPTGG